MCGQKSDSDGYAGKEKERKTEAGVDGQHQARLDREGIIIRRSLIASCIEAVYMERHNTELHRFCLRGESQNRAA